MKLWERVIEQRLRRSVKISDNQFGFMFGRSTMEAIHLLRQLMERYWDKKKDLHMVFIDLEKAYDKIPREVLWWALTKKGISRKYIEWIVRNYKGLQDEIKLVPIDLMKRPDWYKEKVYPENKVPALEHKGKIIGESLDLIKYVDSNFEGPSLFPEDPEKVKFGEELISHVGNFTSVLFTSFRADDTVKQADAQFDYLENTLKFFEDGPFLLGQFSWADIAYIPFVDRFQTFLSEVWKYDITEGRPKLAAWLEEINKIDAYKVTKTDPVELVASFKKRFMAQQ